MRLPTTAFLTTLLSLSISLSSTTGGGGGGGAHAFMVRAHEAFGCKGDYEDINVYDNTCRDHLVPETRSVRIMATGGHRQMAFFWDQMPKGSRCASGVEGSITRAWQWWADGGSDKFLVGNCLDLPFVSEAFSSVSS